MIMVTRLNGQEFVLNADLIKMIEQRPDTIITLVNGDHVVVKEASREVIERVIEYGRRLRRLTPVD
ncbi:MAG: flagellar FlbD family protein [Phycisphaerales bacterium]|nr:flagellar FlbD family protein [Phycisphaerales bacterium]MCB9836685.1 flagellar FlbD family protein [Phycisphaera sp.]